MTPLERLARAQAGSLRLGYGRIPLSLDRLRPRRYRLRQHAERHRIKHAILADTGPDIVVDLDADDTLTLF